jgi:hypothetical protein
MSLCDFTPAARRSGLPQPLNPLLMHITWGGFPGVQASHTDTSSGDAFLAEFLSLANHLNHSPSGTPPRQLQPRRYVTTLLVGQTGTTRL